MPAGTLLLETSFIPICSAPKQLQPDRFFPPRILRLVLDVDFVDHSQNITPEKLHKAAMSVDAHTAKKVIRSQREILQELLEEANKQVAEKLPVLIKESLTSMHAALDEEINRLKELKEINPNVRPDEIDFLYQQREQLSEHLQSIQLRLDSIRVIVTT